MPKVKTNKINLSLGQEENNDNGRQKFNLPYKIFDSYNDLENFVKSKNLQVVHSKKDPCTLCDKRSQTNVYIDHKMEVKFRKCNQDNCMNKKPCFRTENCLLNNAISTNKQRCSIMTTKNHTDSNIVEANSHFEPDSNQQRILPIDCLTSNGHLCNDNQLSYTININEQESNQEIQTQSLMNFTSIEGREIHENDTGNSLSEQFITPRTSHTYSEQEIIDFTINQISPQSQSSNSSYDLNSVSFKQNNQNESVPLLNCQTISHLANTVNKNIQFTYNKKLLKSK